MAVVYTARRSGLDRPVALKILPQHLGRDPKFLGRFRQEAELIARLRHPHILPLLDFGMVDGFTYMAMPLAERGALSAYLSGMPLALEIARDVVVQIGGALGYAHAKGIVHRDVKPTNILIDQTGAYLLTDFGIAKVLAGSAQFTATGAAVGTPTYMSPEQAMSKPVDRRSDLYSLGVILFQMLTGRVPFHAKQPVALAMKHINEPPPQPRTINPGLPIEVERVIVKALAKKPDDRYSTAAEMVRAMDEATSAKG
jgi:serine/threonine-protein kinase